MSAYAVAQGKYWQHRCNTKAEENDNVAFLARHDELQLAVSNARRDVVQYFDAATEKVAVEDGCDCAAGKRTGAIWGNDGVGK